MIETETITETIPYETIENENPDMLIGESKVVQNGSNGERTITYEVEYEVVRDDYGRVVDEKEISRTEVSNEVTVEPVNEIIEIGTGEETNYFNVTVTGENASIEFINSDGEVFSGELNVANELPENQYTLKIVANDGFYISGFYTRNEYGQKSYIEIPENATTVNYDFNLIRNINHLGFENDILDVPEPDVIGFNNLYLMDNDSMVSLSKERFSTTVDVDETIDLGNNIINILELPFKIDESFKRTIKNIVLGDVVLDTTGMQLKSDKYIINFNDIETPLKYNNSYDFINTDVKIHLPFSDIIDVEPEYVIGETINIKYIIDLYTGDTDIIINSTKIGGVFNNQKIKIGRNIPFIRKDGSNLTGLTSQNGVENGVYSPFIEVNRNVPYNVGDSMIQERGVIGEYQGFIRVDRPEIEVDSTLSEKNEIETLLNQGVYING